MKLRMKKIQYWLKNHIIFVVALAILLVVLMPFTYTYAYNVTYTNRIIENRGGSKDLTMMPTDLDEIINIINADDSISDHDKEILVNVVKNLYEGKITNLAELELLDKFLIKNNIINNEFLRSIVSKAIENYKADIYTKELDTQYIQSNQEQLIKMIEENNNSANTKITELQTALDELLKTLETTTTNNNTTIEEIKRQFNEQINSLDTTSNTVELQNAINELRNKIDSLDTSKTLSDTEMEALKKELKALIEKASDANTESLTNTINNTKTELNNTINNTKTELNSSITGVQNSLGDQVTYRYDESTNTLYIDQKD